MQMSNYHDLKRMNLGNHIMVDTNKAIDEMQDLSNDVLIKEELEKLVERLEEENEEMIQDKIEETVEIEENSDTIRIDEEEQEEIKS